MSCNVLLWQSMTDKMLCHLMPWHITYSMSCYDMPCHVMLLYSNLLHSLFLHLVRSYHYRWTLPWEQEHSHSATDNKFGCSGCELPRLTGEQGGTWSPIIYPVEILIPLLCEGAPGRSSSLPTAWRQSSLLAFEVGADLKGLSSGFLEAWQQQQQQLQTSGYLSVRTVAFPQGTPIGSNLEWCTYIYRFRNQVSVKSSSSKTKFGSLHTCILLSHLVYFWVFKLRYSWGSSNLADWNISTFANENLINSRMFWSDDIIVTPL